MHMESWHKPSVHGGEDYRGCKAVRDRDRDSPSFSSTLLDAIYRSIDQGEDEQQQQQGLVLYRETMRLRRKNKMYHHHQGGDEDDDDDDDRMASLRRAIMIEKWMEKKVVVCRKPGPDTRRREHPLVHSSSSSSESSCGGSGFSSSETESTSFRPAANSRSLHLKSAQKPVVRTTISKACGGESLVLDRRVAPILHPHHHPQKAKHESGFAKTKSKALKIYGDLRRVKQPISPGAKLSRFINSLFTAGNAKNPIHSNSERKSKPASTCTSASSFSRSCLSKSPSAVGKRRGGGDGSAAGAMKRSVRFVVDGEGSRACGHKNRTAVCSTDSCKGGGDAKFQVRVQEEAAAARDLLKTFGDGGDESDDGDGASCASSDLFELDNLSSIGIGIGIGLDGRYRDELPVYETTHIAPLPIH